MLGPHGGAGLQPRYYWASAGHVPADVLLVGYRSSHAGWAGGPRSAGWPCSGRHEAWAGRGRSFRLHRLVERSSDVAQPRSCACTTVVLRAISGSTVEELVLTFSVSISAFGYPSVLRPWVLCSGGRLGPAGRSLVPLGLAGFPGSEWSFSSPLPRAIWDFYAFWFYTFLIVSILS